MTLRVLRGKIMGWLERQNEATKAYMGKQALWHTWEVVLVGLCGVLTGIVAAKICQWIVHLSHYSAT